MSDEKLSNADKNSSFDIDEAKEREEREKAQAQTGVAAGMETLTIVCHCRRCTILTRINLRSFPSRLAYHRRRRTPETMAGRHLAGSLPESGPGTAPSIRQKCALPFAAPMVLADIRLLLQGIRCNSPGWMYSSLYFLDTPRSTASSGKSCPSDSASCRLFHSGSVQRMAGLVLVPSHGIYYGHAARKLSGHAWWVTRRRICSGYCAG